MDQQVSQTEDKVQKEEDEEKTGYPVSQINLIRALLRLVTKADQHK